MNANRLLRRLAAPCCCVLVSACANIPQINEFGGLPLPPCTMKDTPFEKEDFADYGEDRGEKPPKYGKWKELYEKEVKNVLADLEKNGMGRESDESQGGGGTQLRCTATTYPEMMPASGPLRTLAGKMELFKGKEDKLSSLDTTSVLMEWMRTYQCSMQEEFVNAEVIIQEEFSKLDEEEKLATFPTVNQEATRRRSYIEQEMSQSQAMMEKMVSVIGGLSRLSPLSAELGCLERSSADIRNSVGLLAEGSACLPRAQQIKTSLRSFTLPEEEE